MKVLVILAHPSPNSLNHAMAMNAVQALQDSGHEVMFHDLYKEKFDPVLPYGEVARDAILDPQIQQYCNELSSADGVVIVHPSWWGQPPAILKGWVDRVFRAGVAYEFKDSEVGRGTPVGLLKAENSLVINTENTPHEIVQQVFGDTLDSIWDKSVLTFCGIKNFHRKVYDQVIISTPEQRGAWLDDVRATIEQIFPATGGMRATA